MLDNKGPTDPPLMEREGGRRGGEGGSLSLMKEETGEAAEYEAQKE